MLLVPEGMRRAVKLTQLVCPDVDAVRDINDEGRSLLRECRARVAAETIKDLL